MSNYTEIVQKSTNTMKMVEKFEEFVEDEMKEIKSYFDDLKKSVQ